MRFIVPLFVAFLAGCVSTASPQFQSIARDANGRVGFCGQVIETGEHVEMNPAEHFPMQSTYKTAIAMTMLREVDRGKFRLDQRITVTPDDYVPNTMHSPLRDRTHGRETRMQLGELIRFAISDSDGTASDVLLREVGSFDSVMKFLHDIDVNEVIVATTEKEMGTDNQAQYRSWATPRGMLQLMIAVHNARGISRSSQQLVLNCMMHSQNSNKRIKGMLPKETEIAHKTGSSDTVDGITAATNDTGIVTLPDGRHMAIAVFVSDSHADNDTREAVIARITRAAYDQFSKKTGEAK